MADKETPASRAVAAALKHARLEDMVFTLHGHLTLENCTFSSEWSFVFVHKNMHEKALTKESVDSFYSNSSRQAVTLIKVHMAADNFVIHVIDVFRGILILQSDIFSSMLLFIGNRTSTCNYLTLVSLKVKDSVLSSARMYIFVNSHFSYGMVGLTNVTFVQSDVNTYSYGGYVGYVIDYCSFDDIWDRNLFLQGTTSIHISNSQFNIKDGALCPAGGCAVYVEGISMEPSEQKLVQKLFYPSCSHAKWFQCHNIHIENTKFFGSGGTTGGGVLRVQLINLVLDSCVFVLNQNSQPPPEGGLIFLSNWNFIFKGRNVTLDATRLKSYKTSVSLLLLKAWLIRFDETQILCPSASNTAVEQGNTPYFFKSQHFICVLSCPTDEYTHERGSVIIEGVFNLVTEFRNLTLNSSTKKIVSLVQLGQNVTTRYKHCQVIGGT